MLDKPEKTYQLLEALKAAVPFEVELTPSLTAHLQAQQVTVAFKPREIVSQISYAGDEGGIVCHIVPKEGRDALIVSLTHVRAHRTLPFAGAVFDYQQHRMNKLKKRNGRNPFG
ncbi:MAG: hypothetical protein ACR2KT_19020 [Methylocella sp.]